MEKANKLTLASDLLSNSDFIEVGCLCIFAKTIFFFSFLETKRIQTIRHTESRLAIYYDRQVKFLCMSEKKNNNSITRYLKHLFLHRNKADDASTEGKAENKEVNRMYSLIRIRYPNNL